MEKFNKRHKNLLFDYPLTRSFVIQIFGSGQTLISESILILIPNLTIIDR